MGGRFVVVEDRNRARTNRITTLNPGPHVGLFSCPKKEATVNTEELPDIPEGVEVSDSAGSETPDVEAPEPVDYSDVEVEE